MFLLVRLKRLMYLKFLILMLYILISSLQVNFLYSSWNAAAGKVNITPKTTVWIAGYAARTAPAVGVLDSLYAKVVVFEDEAANVGVFITADVLGFPKGISDTIRQRIAQNHGIPLDNILLNSSHTHSGPVLENALSDIYPLNEKRRKQIAAYSRLLETKIITMVDEAIKKRAEANVAVGHGVTRFAVNRRENSESDIVTTYELQGPSDHDVPVLKITHARNDSLLAVIMGYACHPTVLNGLEWSGDYPGVAQRVIEKKYPGATALFFQGCGGDQNPIPRRSVSLMKQYGRELAAAVEQVLESENMQPLEPELATGYSEITLDMVQPPDTAELRQVIDDHDGFQQQWAERLLSQLQTGKSLRTTYPYPVQFWCLGEQLLVSLGGEVVVDYAIKIKQLLGQDTFVIGYSNDVMAYIPSVRILREGGYEGALSQRVYGLPSPWAADIEQKIMAEVIRLAKQTGVTLPEQDIK
jgi:hypothetical protein